MKKFRATPLEELPLDWQPHIKSMARVLNQIRSFSKATPEQQERKFNKLYWDVGAIFIAMGVCTNKLPEWTLGHREIYS